MKRFFPLLLGLTFICYSFSYFNVTEPTLSEEFETSAEIAEDDAVISLIKICTFHAVPTSSQYNCPSVAAGLEILPNCQGVVNAGLIVTNLVTNPIIGNKYPLPTGTEEIYFEYTVFGSTHKIGPIDSFTYREDRLDQNLQLFHIYETDIELTFDLSTVCPSQMASFFFDARVIDADDFTYDIGSHAGIDDIFYCGLFKESCNYCASPPNGCISIPQGHELEYDNIMACGNDCGSCPPPRGLTQNETIEVESADVQFAIPADIVETEEESSNTDISIQTLPNPFNDEITLVFNQKIRNISSIHVVDMTGKSVILKENLIPNARQITLKTNELMPGAYICQVLIEDKILTKKIIKL